MTGAVALAVAVALLAVLVRAIRRAVPAVVRLNLILRLGRIAAELVRLRTENRRLRRDCHYWRHRAEALDAAGLSPWTPFESRDG